MRGSTDQLFGRRVDPEVLQVVCVHLGWKLRLLARPRADVLVQPRVEVAQLIGEGRVGLLPSLEAAFLEETFHTIDELRELLLMLVELLDVGSDQLRLVEAGLNVGLGESSDRLVARLEAGVATNPHDDRGAALLGHLRIEQGLHAEEDCLSDVEVGQHEPLVQFRREDPVLLRLNQDLEVLTHARILLFVEGGLKLCDELPCVLSGTLVESRLEIEDLFVVALDAHLSGELRSVLGLELQRLHGVGVAALEPALFGPTGPSQKARRAHEGGEPSESVHLQVS